MNTTQDIKTYCDLNNTLYSPTLSRRAAAVTSYNFPNQSPKKEKKWTFGSLFRRKKKNDTDSSSEDDTQKKGFLRKKRKPDKRKKKVVGTFDHVVVPPSIRNSKVPVYTNTLHDGEVLSDPSSYSAYVDRLLPSVPTQGSISSKHLNASRESFGCDSNKSPQLPFGSSSTDNLNRKSRRELVKARIQARRESMARDSSSDDDSHSSSRFRSDESLSKSHHRDSSLSRRSRAARTERYLKRLSRDDENLIRHSKSDIEGRYMNKHSDRTLANRSPSRSPLPKYKAPSGSSLSHASFSGLSTIPPSHVNNSKLKTSVSFNRPPTFEYAKKYVDFNARMPVKNQFDNQRSLSYEGNINNSLHTEMNDTTTAGQASFRPSNSRIMCSDTHRQPPPPPPRDPKRLGMFYENGRPTSYSFERASKDVCAAGLKSNSFNNDSYSKPNVNTNKEHSLKWNCSGRSTSEDNLPLQQVTNVRLPPRPSSATPEAPEQLRSLRRMKDTGSSLDSYQYLTDKSPRSRKPIFAQPSSSNQKSISQKSIEFWKQRDQQEFNKQEKDKSGSCSPQMFTSQTQLRTKVFLPESAKKVMNANKYLMKPLNSEPNRISPISSSQSETKSSIEEDVSKRKSANLEEALDELEAIYNSLRLGDEDLLERAEEREKAVATQKLIESKSDSLPGYNGSKGIVSDSSYNYERLDNVDSGKRKRLSRRSRVADIEKDDMAFRKLNKERSLTINNPQGVVSKVSYLLASPVYNTYEEEVDLKDNENKGREPDVTLDDVVYRSIKHANNTLKVVEPQPPFGIPIGPVAPGANSDYLHAVPEATPEKIVKRKKIPDVVKDDLAFRNLRKDGNKEPALPQLTGDDFINNNASKFDYNSLKKRRAVRSLSANISSLMGEIPRRTYSLNGSNNNENENDTAAVSVPSTANVLTDVADAMEIARQVLKEKENRINATRRGFLSDTDASILNKEAPSHTNSLRLKRLNFLNGLRHDNETSCDNEHLHQKLRVHIPLLGDDYLQAKPPRCLTPDRKVRSPTKESTPIPMSPLEMSRVTSPVKESTPIPLSPLETTRVVSPVRETTPIRWSPSEARRGVQPVKESTPIPVSPLEDTKLDFKTSSFDDLLRSIAKETKECSDKITEELNNLSSSVTMGNNDKCLKVASDDIPKKATLSKHLSEIDAVSEQVKLCENFLESVADGTDLLEEGEIKNLNEQPEATVANIVVPCNEKQNETDNAIESEHDYENMVSDRENEIPLPVIEKERESKSPFEEHKEELVAAFKKIGESDEQVADTSSPDKEEPVDDLQTEKQIGENVEDEGELSVNVLNSVALQASNRECVLATKAIATSLHLDNKFRHSETLKSPRLVLETARSSSSSSLASSNQSRDSNSVLDECKPTRPWYCDPVLIAIACIYGAACAHQVASLDFPVFVALVFVVLSVITALIF